MKNTPNNKTAQQAESVAKVLATIYETGYVSKHRLIGLSLLKGFMTGLGGILGATIGIALLIGLLSLFDEVPLIGDVVRSIRDTINQ